MRPSFIPIVALITMLLLAHSEQAPQAQDISKVNKETRKREKERVYRRHDCNLSMHRPRG